MTAKVKQTEDKDPKGYARKRFDREWNEAVAVKRIDHHVINDLYGMMIESKKERAGMSIENERRYRKQIRIKAEIPNAPWRFAGRQSLMDVPCDVPLEKIILDELGRTLEYGEGWVCEHCHTHFSTGLPPDVCPICKTPSMIASGQLNLRR